MFYDTSSPVFLKFWDLTWIQQEGRFEINPDRVIGPNIGEPQVISPTPPWGTLKLKIYKLPSQCRNICLNAFIQSFGIHTPNMPFKALQCPILNTLDPCLTHSCTSPLLSTSSNSCPSSSTLIAATSLLPLMMSAAFILSLVGRSNQSLEPPAGAICKVDLQRLLPESRTSKRSNSPHPEVHWNC